MAVPDLIDGEFNCPYCGEINEILVDPTGGEKQDYVEDCSVCCRPVEISIRILPDGTVILSVTDEGS